MIIKRHSIQVLTFLCISLCIGIATASAARVSVKNPRCRSLENPVGVENANFSWQIADKTVGSTQRSYEIQIASSIGKLRSGKADVWNPGIRVTDDQLHIIPNNAKFNNATKYWWRVRVNTTDFRQSSWSAPASFVTGIEDADWKADWIAPDWSKCQTQPYLRKQFNVSEKPVLAVVYVCALGCGDLWLNGHRVDETAILNPAQTNYEQYAYYTSYDITNEIARGANCLGVVLGDGWYHQNVVWGKIGDYGTPKIRLQLVLRYADGHSENVISDESWQWRDSPVLKSNIYAGEVYDATKQIDGWATAAFNASDWNKVSKANDNLPPHLFPQMLEPIRLLDAVKPVKTWKDKNGNWIIDFGINMAAVPSINVNLPKGTTLKMRMGENVNADSTIDYSTTGPDATGVIQTDEYTCRGGGNETWTPRFTYHGFRYLELSGVSQLPKGDFIEAVRVHSAVEKSGDFTCDNPIINRMHEMAVRTFLSNIHGIPTDCPHRERCGWLGDAHTAMPFESLNYGMENFYLKYMDDVNSSANFEAKKTLFHHLYNSQFYFRDKPVGLSYMIAPGRRQCGVASPDWGTAQVQIPWNLYWLYGNKESLKKSYEYMKVWTDHVSEMSVGYIVPNGLGDWCPPAKDGAAECPVKFSSTAFHYRDVTIMRDVARLLGYNDEAQQMETLRGKIEKAVVDTFYNAQTKTFGSQTADAMALDYGLVPAGDNEAVAASIVRSAHQQHNDFLHVGIFGLARVGQALARNGHAADACKLFAKQGENSFEWMWTGANATTLWETLPINTPSKKIGLGESLNHPMQGGYDLWFIEDIAGLRAAEPGYHKTHFEHVDGTLIHSAHASLDTPYGVVLSDWKENNGVTVWNIAIPTNTTGEVVIPNGKTATIGGKPIDKVSTSHNGNLYTMPSGNFTITYK